MSAVFMFNLRYQLVDDNFFHDNLEAASGQFSIKKFIPEMTEHTDSLRAKPAIVYTWSYNIWLVELTNPDAAIFLVLSRSHLSISFL